MLVTSEKEIVEPKFMCLAHERSLLFVAQNKK